MLAATLTLASLSALSGAGFSTAGRRKDAPPESLIEPIERLLPQTQCGQCGYDGCTPYAVAIANGEAEINQCPPGGDRGIQRLAQLLGRPVLPLNPENGVAKIVQTVALIDESRCIGCTLCIQACPVDAIAGANQLMHTVIADECTGCELCLPPCPVDCITMEVVEQRAISSPPIQRDEMPCIRCGECAKVCPPLLLPQELHRHTRAGQHAQAAALALFDCIECGRCDTVCPSHIPLLAHFQAAKAVLREQDSQQLQADIARKRHDARELRLAREELEQAEARLRKKASLAQYQAATDDPVATALARARARKNTPQHPS